MVAFDQRTSIPMKWSLKPEDTLGLMFWTKNPANLLRYRDMFRPYNTKVHVTVTGWEEVEKGAPGIFEASILLRDTARAYGPENVTWRFSPVPVLPHVKIRFKAIASVASTAGVQAVYLSFLQPNDLVPETRSEDERKELLQGLADIGKEYGIEVRLCNEDRLLEGLDIHPNLISGVCAKPEDFALPSRNMPPAEGCGCVMAVDPFTLNESCNFGCFYCYAADKSLAPKKRNTTRNLPVIR